MEACLGYDLFSYLERRKFSISESRACRLVYKIVKAVYYLHEYNVVHRDLKLENILTVSEEDDADIKLIDFGLSKIFPPNSLSYDNVGTVVN